MDLTDLPKFVHEDFIDLDMIDKISKFRSGAGHSFTAETEETCRSMKHYFGLKGIDEAFGRRLMNNQVAPDEWPVVRYFAPVDGELTDLMPDEDVFGLATAEFRLQSSEYPQILFNFFHVRLAEGLKEGDEVEAGQFLGTVGGDASGEMAVLVVVNRRAMLVSFFEVIDDDVFAEYQARGVESSRGET